MTFHLAPRRSNSPPPNGVSLVEMLLMLALSSVVLAIVSVGFTSLMRLDRKFADGRSAQAKQQPLVAALRRDGHLSVRFRFDQASQTMSFWTPAGEEIRYEMNETDCKRQVVDQADTHTVFRMPGGAQWSAEPVAGGANALLVLTVAVPQSVEQAARDQPIKIAVGRDVVIAGGVNP